ncbi:MAG: gamma carbonic anhydrase family protein [Eubacteriales bacterium]|nr:gamma carbonic anhydrase family protein [Eubacteriales bacterium]
MELKYCGNIEPKVDKAVFIADTATVVGDVTIGEGSSVWFGAVLRADNEAITIGKNTNIQDGAVVHEDTGNPVIIGDNVTIGHRAIVHGCTIGDNSLIGMGAILLSGCRIGNNCMVAAGALVTGKMDIPDGSIVMGAPAKTIKPLSDELKAEAAFAAEEYKERGKQYLNGDYKQA